MEATQHGSQRNLNAISSNTPLAPSRPQPRGEVYAAANPVRPNNFLAVPSFIVSVYRLYERFLQKANNPPSLLAFP